LDFYISMDTEKGALCSVFDSVCLLVSNKIIA